jgi:hypothetical protein
MIVQTIRARGHRNVTGTHRSTFEVTRDPEITAAADCIIAVSSDCGAASLSDQFRKAAAGDEARIRAVISCDGHSDTVTGWGSPRMTFTDPSSMVFRVSDFVCGRTVMIGADRPAARLDRGLIAALAAGKDVVIEMTVEREQKPRPSFDTLFGGE